ncbi:MAG: hypothetical protein ACOC1F_14840, partial [Myxococcota bacterium]
GKIRPRQTYHTRHRPQRSSTCGDARGGGMKERRSYQDVSGRIDVCDPGEVRREVELLVACVHPDADFVVLGRAFDDFMRLFEGRFPGYNRCDTLYHDVQHTLDVTLTMGRLLHGHERTAQPAERLGARRVISGLATALFHDAGYIRTKKDTKHRRGAEYTRWHVARSARFLRGWLSRQQWRKDADIASKVVHFTGYEVALQHIRLPDPRDWRLGCLLGTADLIAQMSARNYLERCRDYLYEEFVAGGIATHRRQDGTEHVLYASAEDLLRKTPSFYEHEVRRRLDDDFGRAYRYASVCFGGANPYLEEIEKNIEYLRLVIERNDFSLLRRSPAAHPRPREARKDACARAAMDLHEGR